MPPNEENLSFYPWIKRGMGAYIEAPPTGSRRAVVRVKVSLEAEPKPTPAPAPTETTVPLELIGPGDIASLDPRAISRTWPKPDVTDVETSFFPMVEFSEADLPWRYTPNRATEPAKGFGGDTLEPWLVLIVLNDDEWESVQPATAAERTALPAIRVPDVDVLPSLANSWAWAHIQVSGTQGNLGTILKEQPERAVSRIFCPRRLDVNKAYTAFLVPSYASGVRAGLGQAVDPASPPLALAWGTSSDVVLPVYHQWRFHTGTSGSFAQLARRLVPRVLSGTAFREMDVTDPGMGILPKPDRTAVAVEGALRPLDASIPEWPPADRAEFKTQIEPKLNAPADALTSTQATPVLAPPLYGQWHAAKKRLESGVPSWFEKLNVEPQSRAAAAVGTEVVQREQQALLASAWNQVDGIRQANQQMRELQLAREASGRLFKRHIKASPRFEQLFQIATPVFSRFVDLAGTPTTPGLTVQGSVDQSPVPVDILRGPWRRLVAPLGGVGRRQGRPGDPPPPPGKTLLERTNDGEISPAPTPPTPTGAATPPRLGANLAPECLTPQKLDQLALIPPSDLLFWALAFFFDGRSMASGGSHFWLSRSLLRVALRLVEAGATVNGIDALRADVGAGSGTVTPTQVGQAPVVDGFARVEPPPSGAGSQPPPPLPPPGATDNAALAAFRAAAQALLGRLGAAPLPGRKDVILDLNDLGTKVLGGLDPITNLNPIGRGKVSISDNIWDPVDPLEPVMAAPEFPQPMYEPLRDVSLEWILPGISTVPADTVALLETNKPFIEAYMAGVNHEMSRELLWNEYPTDQRGTYFFKFWDTRGFVTTTGPDPSPETQKDIRPMHQWTGALGSHSPRVPQEGLVLFLRGELLRRYPHVVVYIASATGSPRKPSDTHEYPIFAGNLSADTGFYGFERGEGQIVQPPGWYFVLQEPPGEPRFGWENAAAHPAVEEHAVFGAGSPHHTSATGAQAAGDTLITPKRVAIFATAMLP